MEQTVWQHIQAALNDIDFPAAKEDIVAHAERRSAPPDAVKALRALPLGTYQNIAELRGSVRLRPAADEGQSAAERALHARSPHSGRIAQHLREP